MIGRQEWHPSTTSSLSFLRILPYICHSHYMLDPSCCSKKRRLDLYKYSWQGHLQNYTSLEVPLSRITSKDSDCASWRNRLDQVCYDCDKWKAAYMEYLQVVEGASTNAASYLPIIISFVIAFWPFKQASMDVHLSCESSCRCLKYLHLTLMCGLLLVILNISISKLFAMIV